MSELPTRADTEQHVQVPLDQLVTHPLNVRATGRFSPDTSPSDAGLVESIRRHGILQPILVAPIDDVTMGVVAGRRRLLALRHIGEHTTAPCTIRHGMTDAEIASASIDENDERDPLSVADTALAIAQLSKAGMSADEISVALGQSLQTVRRFQALAHVHPEILAYYREQGYAHGTDDVAHYGEDGHEVEDIETPRMTLEHLVMYSRVPDQDRQLEVHQACLEEYGRHHYYPGEWELRKAIAQQPLRTSAPLAKLVQAEYTERGGAVHTDLFGEDETLSDRELAETIAQELLEAEKQKLIDQGYGWVDGTLQTYDSRLNTMESQTPAPRSKAGRAECGAIVTLGHDGQFTHHRNLISRQEARKAERQKERQAQKAAAGIDGADDDTTPPLPMALEADLDQVLYSTLRMQLIDGTSYGDALAFQILHFEICRAMVRNYPIGHEFLDSNFLHEGRDADTMGGTSAAAYSRATAELVDKNAALQAIARASSTAEAWQGFWSQEVDGDRTEAISLSVAHFITKSLVHRLRAPFAARLELDPRSYWTPTVDNYFGRLKKVHLVEIAPSLMPADWCTETLPRLKVKQIAQALAEAAADNPDWLPPELRREGDA